MKAPKLVLILFMTMTIRCFSQEFNGTITYKVEIKNPMPELVSDSMYFQKIGGKSSYIKECFYQGNEFKTVAHFSNENPKKIELLDLTSNRLFTYIEKSDSAKYIDISSNPLQVTEIIRNTETEKIIGIDCQSIKFITSMGEITFYYSNKYTISPERYNKFNYGLFNKIYLETNAVPLKIETKNMFMHTIETATNIKQEEISQQTFKLPEFKHIEKSAL